MTARELLAVLVIGMVQNYSRKFHIGPALLCAVFARRSCESHNITVIESRAIHTSGLVTNCAIAVMDTLTLVAVLLSEMTAAAVAEMLAVATVLCAVLLNARSRAAAARLCVTLLRLTRMRTNVSAESRCSKSTRARLQARAALLGAISPGAELPHNTVLRRILLVSDNEIHVMHDVNHCITFDNNLRALAGTNHVGWGVVRQHGICTDY